MPIDNSQHIKSKMKFVRKIHLYKLFNTTLGNSFERTSINNTQCQSRSDSSAKSVIPFNRLSWPNQQTLTKRAFIKPYKATHVQ